MRLIDSMPPANAQSNFRAPFVPGSRRVLAPSRHRYVTADHVLDHVSAQFVPANPADWIQNAVDPLAVCRRNLTNCCNVSS